MKYQTRLILGYATVALLLSISLGIVVYRISLDYEADRQERNLAVTSEQLVSQMEEQLKRMDAIIYYILSDSSMLDSIKTLGMVSEGTVPSAYALNSKTELRKGFNTEYIIKNSYRTVFYNQLGDLISSFNLIEAHQLSEGFDLSEISYLERAEQANGKTVLIGPHVDKWGRENGSEVYSMMKALQGFQMGYIEVENTVESLEELAVADPNAEFLIVANGTEVLYSSSGEYPEKEIFQKLAEQENGKTTRENGMLGSKRASGEFDFFVIAYVSELEAESGRFVILVTATIASIVSFGLCLLLIVAWSYALAKPIRNLRELIEQTNLENLEMQPVQTNYGLDEVSMLTNSYQIMTERLSQAVRNEKHSLMLQMQAQFDTLQAQINPHFLYNVLNIISSRGIEDDDDMICDMCGALANMLRYSTNNKERYAKAEQEIQYLEDYLYLLKARYGEKISFEISMDSAVREELLPKMTLHQFVENILAHAYVHSDQKMEIHVSGTMYPDHWEISVRDNGEGIEEKKLKEIQDKIEKVRKSLLDRSGMELEIGGMGLINTYARCFLLYNDNLIFSLQNLPSGGMEVKVGEMLDRRGEKDVSGVGSG